MPIEFTEATPKYNASMCETLGIEPLEATLPSKSNLITSPRRQGRA